VLDEIHDTEATSTQTSDKPSSHLLPWLDPELNKTPWENGRKIPSSHLPLEWTAHHPIPYLILRADQPAHNYDAVFTPLPDGHTGAPPTHPVYERASLSFDYLSTHSYDKRSTLSSDTPGTVVELSRTMYALNPPANDLFDTSEMLEHIIQNEELSMGVIARFILNGSDKVSYR
jgi:hypothetical protein